mmetsp:Transcript_42158/g.65789  ORF Transcript_42158/g.65789 Transcript_42158/m.65789 type:complete len:413 (-) Transcript_42158:7-1245(-)
MKRFSLVLASLAFLLEVAPLLAALVNDGRAKSFSRLSSSVRKSSGDVAPRSVSQLTNATEASVKQLSNTSNRSFRDRPQQTSPSTRPRWATFVINLDRRPTRLQRFKEALLRDEPWLLENGTICRVRGRDGQEISRNAARIFRKPTRSSLRHKIPSLVPESVEDLDSLVQDGWVATSAAETAESSDAVWPAMTRGGIGLYFGHVDAWRKVWESNVDYGLIFEDDATLFSPRFEEEVSRIVARPLNVAASWDFLYLQRCNDDLWLKERSDWSIGDTKLPKNLGKPALVRIMDRETVTCTGAYIITRSGAKKLLEGALPATMQLDYQLGNVTGLRRAALSPPVAQCSEVITDSNGKKRRDTDVQQNSERIHMRQLEMDKAAEAWLREWRQGLSKRRTTFLAKHSVVHDIPTCAS